ncbi:pyridoxal phosphate-dependent transferase [Diplogelasinospora grovesii]|uniref:Pyridoxal phosphate-dependent transferase n=1 Tax=Diplogelasinospora grovesii TaxID=303347 RepID=A0AAN6S1G9_9PEZI|nr:pyridoxal phosphate-dependent transferase [Diplogelasinospora grovesii]
MAASTSSATNPHMPPSESGALSGNVVVPVFSSSSSSSSSAPSPGPDSLSAAFGKHQLSLASRSVHADDYINNHQAVAPPLHVSTTYRYSDDPEQLVPWMNVNPAAPYDSHIYSRDSAPNTTRLEALLSSIIGAPCLTYASGLAAFHAMLVFLNPKRIAIGGGYHGCHGVIQLVGRMSGLQQLTLEELDTLEAGDVIHVETPLNPTGEARDMGYYAAKAAEKRCFLTVDATFGPPPLFDPFRYKADLVMHSGTKYFGGHSDLLCGVLAVRPDHQKFNGTVGGRSGERDWVEDLKNERLYLGSVMGSLEGWLGVRSLRTLELRVMRQSQNAQRLVDWLAAGLVQEAAGTTKGGFEEGAGGGADEAKNDSSSSSSGGDGVVSGLVLKIQHASQQPEASDPNSWLCKQMPNGYGPVFAIWMKDPEDAKRLPSKLHLFHHATSLGGVESLIEWRAMTDKSMDKRLLRLSIGVEAWEDLKQDLLQGFRGLAAEKVVRKGEETTKGPEKVSTVDEQILETPMVAS